MSYTLSKKNPTIAFEVRKPEEGDAIINRLPACQFLLAGILVISCKSCLVPTSGRLGLEPTPISERKSVTYRDLALMATEHLDSARPANSDKAARKQILAAN
jgi:hypothetical protein